MPAAAVLKEVGDVATIKISSKRQITIPSAVQKKYGFREYALCTLTEEGILIQPIDLADDSEDLSVELLRFLISEGLEGDELLEKYKEIKPKFIDYSNRIIEAERDFSEGRVVSFETAIARVKEKNGL